MLPVSDLSIFHFEHKFDVMANTFVSILWRFSRKNIEDLAIILGMWDLEVLICSGAEVFKTQRARANATSLLSLSS
ncbi:MAG TPA: hypothetical protein DEA55_06150 [Rhodospirillaceae bacterium]|nr:hypothetical protein [Rhodospirillaceae bacterium]